MNFLYVYQILKLIILQKIWGQHLTLLRIIILISNLFINPIIILLLSFLQSVINEIDSATYLHSNYKMTSFKNLNCKSKYSAVYKDLFFPRLF